MSLRSYSIVWEGSKATGNELLVLLAIAEHYNPTKGFAWPSVERIALYARVSSLRTVQRHIRTLSDRGEMKVALGGGRQNPSRYYLNFEMLKRNAEARNKLLNPAEFAGFKDKPRQSVVEHRPETPPKSVVNPANQWSPLAGEGIKKPKKPTKRKEAEPERPPAAFSFSDFGIVLFNLNQVYPHATDVLSYAEEIALTEAGKVLFELTGEDWLALQIWTNEADDICRGCRLWPTNRSQFLTTPHNALEKVRQWWAASGKAWWTRRLDLAAKKEGRQTDDPLPSDPPLTPEEALHFLNS